jgi:hypothetical protein
VSRAEPFAAAVAELVRAARDVMETAGEVLRDGVRLADATDDPAEIWPDLVALDRMEAALKPFAGFPAVSGAGLTEAGGPPLTLVSPGTPSEPSASPAAETSGREGAADEILAARTTGAVGGKSVRGVCRELASGGLHRDAAAPSVPDASVGGRDVRGVEGHAAIQTAGDLGTATQPCEPPAAVLDTPRIAGIKPGRTSLAPDAVSLPARPHGGPEDQAGAAAPAYAAFAPGEQCGEPGCFCMRFFK